MSYPEPRYFGDAGETSATIRPNDQKPDLTYPKTGVTVDYLATGATTDGEFGLYRWNFGPGESGPGPHFHRTINEYFYILTGTVRIFNGTDWVDTRAGDFTLVPKGGLHGFRNVADEPASMLLMFTPGAPREGYFEGLAELAAGKQLTEEERAEFYRYHDNYWVDL
jgi:mannose-6-phosphate isomerase-like protein (cupin superfamily)